VRGEGGDENELCRTWVGTGKMSAGKGGDGYEISCPSEAVV